MDLQTESAVISNVSEEQLRAELRLLSPEDNYMAILSVAEQTYLQTAANANGFVIEMRDGDESTHRHAVPQHEPLPAPQDKRKKGFWSFLAPKPATHTKAFTHAEMEQAFLAYLEGDRELAFLTWESGYS